MVSDHQVGLGNIESRDRKVDIRIGKQDGQFAEFCSQRLAIPAGIESDTVLRECQRPLLQV